jgi:hypothetical protein
MARKELEECIILFLNSGLAKIVAPLAYPGPKWGWNCTRLSKHVEGVRNKYFQVCYSP